MLNSRYTLSISCILTCWNRHMTHYIVCTPSPLILGHLMRPYPRELLKQRHWIAFFIALIVYFYCQIQNFKTLLSRPYSKTSSYLYFTGIQHSPLNRLANCTSFTWTLPWITCLPAKTASVNKAMRRSSAASFLFKMPDGSKIVCRPI